MQIPEKRPNSIAWENVSFNLKQRICFAARFVRELEEPHLFKLLCASVVRDSDKN